MLRFIILIGDTDTALRLLLLFLRLLSISRVLMAIHMSKRDMERKAVTEVVNCQYHISIWGNHLARGTGGLPAANDGSFVVAPVFRILRSDFEPI